MQFPPHPEWQRVLTDILAAARAAGPAGVVAFDLDSTLLDNRPRQAAIVRDFASRHGIAALERFGPEHLVTGFDTREALARAGLDPESVTRWLPDLRRHWVERFFTSEACLHDIPVRGAAAYARRVHATGIQITYLTARPERMRPGTEEVLRRFGVPLPGEGVALWMKPDDPSIGDDDFKRSAHARLASLGRLVAAFDNEPGHVNDFRQTFPEAEVVLVATGHSGRVSTLAPRVSVVPNLEVDPEP
jgi:phosphoglycolate phosphatase-like HAD superfamily hydrolase